MEFVIHCIPPKHTAQASNKILKDRNGNMFIGKMSDSKAKQTQTELMWLLSPYQPKTPMKGALKETVRWIYPYRKSEPKKNRNKEIWCDTRSDCDNLVKLFNDCLTRLGFWFDDSQVAILHFEKLYAEIPRIEVEIEELI